MVWFMQFHFLLIIYYSTFVGMVRFGYVPNNWCGTSCDVVLNLKWVPLVLIILTQGTKDVRDHIVCIEKKNKIGGMTWELCIDHFDTRDKGWERSHCVYRKENKNQRNDLRALYWSFLHKGQRMREITLRVEKKNKIRGGTWEEEKKMKKKGQRMRSHCVYRKKQNQRRDLRRGEEDEEEGTKDEITLCV